MADVVEIASRPRPNVSFSNMVDLITGIEPPVTWLIEGFIPEGSIIALAGLPGAGKSFLSYTLGLGLATGTSVLGWSLEPRKVLYFDQENSYADYTQYIRWAWHGLGCPSLGLVTENFCLAPAVLGQTRWRQHAQDYVEASQPALIIIDTASPAFNVQDENDNAEATRHVQQLRSLQALCVPRPAVLLLKHAKIRSEGKSDNDTSYTLRGAKAWEGAVDSVIFHTRGRGQSSNGLSHTFLTPSKTRAFGLRERVHIRPSWLDNKAGLKLSREAK